MNKSSTQHPLSKIWLALILSLIMVYQPEVVRAQCVNSTPSISAPACGGSTTIASASAGGKLSYNVPSVSGAYYTVSISAGSNSCGSYSVSPASFYGTGANVTISVYAGGSCCWASGGTSATLTYSRPGVGASISGGSPAVCAGTSPGTYTASGSGGDGSYSYLWYLDAASTGVTTSTYNPGTGVGVGTHNVYCAVTSALCTANTSTSSFTVVANPSGGSIAATSWCSSTGSGTVSVSGVSNATQYVWSLPPNLTGSSSGTSISLTGSTPGTYTVSVTPQDVASGVTCSGAQVTGTVNVVATPSGGSIAATSWCSSTGSGTVSVSGVSNANTYTWSLPPGLTGSSTTNSISLTGSTPGTYTVSVTPKDAAAGVTCSGAQVTGTVNVVATPSGGSIAPVSYCSSVGSASVSVTGVSGATQYAWALPAGLSGSSTSSSITVTGAAAGTYTVSVTPQDVASGVTCSGSQVTGTVTVSTASTAVTSISGGGTVCQGTGVTLGATGGSLGTGANYQWGTGNIVGTNAIGGATSSTYSVTPSSTTSYWVSVSGPAPCGGASGTYTTVNVATPSTAVTGITGGGTVCQGTGVTLTATGGSLGTGANYQWGTGNVVGTNSIPGATSSTYSVTPSSTTSYWVSVTGPSPCNGAGGVSTTVNVATPSTAVTSISGGGTVCQGTGVTLTANGGSLGTGANYQWGTGTTIGTNAIAGATSSTYTVTPSSTTSYWVSVTGPSPCNGAGGIYTTVTVATPSTAVTSISGGGTVCQGTGVTLTANGGSLGTGANYQWGTGTTIGSNAIAGATSSTYSVTPSSTTSYWVSVTGPSPCNGAGGVSTTVNVATPSTAVTSISGGGTVCQGTGVTLTANGGSLGTGANYQWGTGNVVGTNAIAGATSSTYTVTPSSTTSYWVSVTGPSPCNGAGGTYTTVTVATPSTAVTGISGTTTLCSGNGTTLTATGGSLGTGANYQWGTGTVVGTNTIAGATSATYSVTPSSTTSYWVSVSGPSPCNGAGGVYTTVNVTPTPTPSFVAVPSNPSCTYSNVTYTTQSGYSNYVWSGFGTAGVDYTIVYGGLSSTDYTVTLQWLSTGTKAVSISYSNGSCAAVTPGTNSTVINASPSPALSTSGAYCTSNSVVYTTQAGQSNYTWTIGGTSGVDYTLVAGGTTSSNTATIQWITTGNKTVSVNYTNASGCTGPTAASTTNLVSSGPTSASLSDVIDPCNGGHTATVTVNGGTSPYNFTVCGTAFTNQNSPFELDATNNSSCSLSFVSDANGCAPGTISGSPVSYPSRVLTSGDTYACTVSTGATKIFYDNSGNLMVKITDGGSTLGSTNVAVTIDGSIHQFGPTSPQSYLQRHFRISPTNTSGNATVCLYMTNAEVAALSSASASDNHSAPSFYSTFQTNMSNAVVTKFHGGSETPLSNTSRIVLTPISKTPNPVVNGVTYNNVWEVCLSVSSWSGFYVHAQNVNNTPLPVSLLYLTADAVDNKYIDLDWATASEINNKGFAIERSTNGSDFTQVGWVDGHGNSNTQLSYTYSDRSVQPGVVYYYRLKQVDFDGASVYSEIVSASLIGDKGFSFEDMIPNPAINTVQLGILTTAGQKATVTITDMVGRVVLTQPWQLAEGYNINSFDISGLAQGTYSVTVYAGNSFTTRKLVVTR